MPTFKTIRDLAERPLVTGADWIELQGAASASTEKKTLDGALEASFLNTRVDYVEELYQKRALIAAGAVFDGINDDAPAIQTVVNDLGARGGRVWLPPRPCYIGTPILFQGKPVEFRGAPTMSSTRGTALIIGCADAFTFDSAAGSNMSDFYMTATGEAATSGFMISVTNSIVGGLSTNLSFERIRAVNGWGFMKVQGGFWINARAIRAGGFVGDQVVLLNGLNDITRCDAFEAENCYFSSASGNSTTDLIVIDGKSFSHKFNNSGGVYGRHGLTMRNTAGGAPKAISSISQSAATGGYRIVTAVGHGLSTGDEVLIYGVSAANTGTATDVNGTRLVTVISSNTFDLDDTVYITDTYTGGTATATLGATPSFVYFTNGGFENGQGDAVRLEVGKLFEASNAYFSTDGMGNGINILPSFGGDYILTGIEVRGNGRDGIRVARGFGSITGVQAINNGSYYEKPTYAIASIANNGSGLARIVTTTAHGYTTGDTAAISGAPSITSSATQRPITVINSTTFDLVGSTYAAGYTSGGKSLRTAGAVTGAVDNGSGLIRVTVANHPFLTDDYVVIAGVGGVTAANGEWAITKIDANTFDLQGSTFAGTYSSAGTVQFLSANIHILETVQQLNITGGSAGRGGTGVNRAAYGIINRSSDVQIANVNTYGNRLGPLKNTRISRTARIRGLSSVEQVDFMLTGTITGAVANGSYYFANMRYLVNKRFRIIRATRVLGAGTCSVRPRAAGAAILSAAISATTTLTSTLLTSPGDAVHTSGTPTVIDFEILSASGASDLVVQFECQWIG